MADISKLKGITVDEATKLRAANVKTIEDLWMRISEEQDNALTQIAQQTGISEQRLTDLLTTEGLRNTGRLGSSWLKQHWLDLVLILGLLALVALVWRTSR